MPSCLCKLLRFPQQSTGVSIPSALPKHHAQQNQPADGGEYLTYLVYELGTTGQVEYKFDLMLSTDGSGRGAALVAAVLKSQEEA